jgi:hypothetical protein
VRYEECYGNGAVLNSGAFDWAGAAAPWWVTPIVALASVVITARATNNRDWRSERRKAVVERRKGVQEAFGLDTTAPYRSFLPQERDLEIALIELGFRRFEVWDMIRRLYDHRREHLDPDRPIEDLSLRELTRQAFNGNDWRNLQDVLTRYLSGEISLFRARRKLHGYAGILRRGRVSRRWAKNQYRALHPRR